MMLYVFHVDSGTMKTFDMRLVSESVDLLKQAVEQSSGIPVDKQVLLISGGECLDGKKSIAAYAAGTDTNPIFLFSKTVLETPGVPPPSGESDFRDDTDEKIREAMDLPASFNTVHRRTQLAQLLYERAKEQLNVCERLVHDQHLQQQGWSAVVASLEDITVELKKRAESFKLVFVDYLQKREFFVEISRSFQEDIDMLKRIPVLHILDKSRTRLGMPDLQASKEEETDTQTSQSTETSNAEEKTLSLYEWLARDGVDMVNLHEHCKRGLDNFTNDVYQNMTLEVLDTLASADNNQMKEVKGLGERLIGLETLMREAKRKVQEHAENAKSFHNNQSRVSNLKDASILPDLCASHRKQLAQMNANYQQLCDIRRRCAKAKEELSANLFHRLKWVMFIQNKIFNIDQQLIYFHDGLARLKKVLECVQQIHVTPALYLCTVAEVVHRRKFSQSFLMWASDLACQLLAIYNTEVSRRKDFQAQFRTHFLNSLFLGMNDMPPAFATQAPPPFDSELPRLTLEDVERLRVELPEFAEHLEMPDDSGFTNFFMIKSMVKTELDKMDEATEMNVDEKLQQAMQGVGLVDNLDNNLMPVTGTEPTVAATHALPHLRDIDRGCESETDTEEFEKVGQSPLDPSPRPGTQDAATSIEDNLQISRSEHERLKGTLETLGILSTEALNQLRTELSQIKKIFITEKDGLEGDYCNLVKYQNLVLEARKADQATIESLTSTINSMKNMFEEKENEFSSLKIAEIVLQQKYQKAIDDYHEIRTNLAKLNEEHSMQIVQLQKEITEKDLEKEKVLKETVDRLNREHKAELENIRSRFKLMTMERSPSDSSLEKIGDFSSIPNHESILQQMNETFEMTKDKAIKEAIDRENVRWKSVLDERILEMTRKFEEEKQQLLDDVAKKIQEEKDKQIDILRERVNNLNLEIAKHKSTIQQLTEQETYSDQKEKAELKEKIDQLSKENEALRREMEKKPTHSDMAASVAVLEETSQVATENLATSTSAEVAMIQSAAESICESSTASRTSKIRKPYTDRCPIGSEVEIYWDTTHQNYRVDVDGKLYFLHCDYLSVMDLEVVNGIPNKTRVVAEVIEKEYCISKKDDNRYKVPKGKKFFRVKVKPVDGMGRSESRTAGRPPPIPEILGAEPAISEIEQPEEILPESIEKNSFQDSGCVEEQVEEAAVAIEKLNPGSGEESDDRYMDSSMKLSKSRPNWLGMMVSRLFGKNEDI